MRDQDSRASLAGALDGTLNLVFGGAVNGAGRVVQDQDGWVGQKGTRQGNALALPAGQRDAALAHHRRIAFGKAADKIVRLRRARRRLDLLLRGPWLAKGDVIRNRAAEQENILLDDRNLAAQARQVPIAHVDAVDQDTPAVHIIDAVEQLGDGALAAACLPHQGQRLPGRQVKRNARQGVGDAACRVCGGSHRISKVHLLKADRSLHVSRVAALVLVQVRRVANQFQDAPCAGKAGGHLRIGKHRGEDREIKKSDQPHVGHNVAHADDALTIQKQGMPQRRTRRQTQQQQRQKARLDPPLCNQRIAHRRGILDKSLHFGFLLRRALDRGDAVDSLGQPTIHHAKGAPHLRSHRLQIAQVEDHRYQVGQCKKQRRGDQAGRIARGHNDGHQQKDRRADDQVKPRRHHQRQLAHVVGGARHDLAGRAQVMKPHAFAQQRAV